MKPVAVAESAKGPVRAAYALLRNPGGLYLALRRAGTARNNPGCWDLPGGKLDDGEDVEAGLRREILEETTLEVEPGRVLGEGCKETDGKPARFLIFEATAGPGAVRLSEEHEQHRWVAEAELREIAWCPHFRAKAPNWMEWVRRP